MKGDSFEKICVVDTSALIDYPPLVNELVEGGNLVLVPAMVHKELTGKKRDKKPDIANDAKDAIFRMNQLRKADHPLLRTNRFPNWEGISKLEGVKSLEKDVPDDVIIAVALSAYKEYPGKEIVLITQDQGMQLKARDMKDGKKPCLTIEECRQTKGATLSELRIPLREIPEGTQLAKGSSFSIKAVPDADAIPENGGVICTGQFYGESSSFSRPFIRKGSRLVAVPDGISLFGVKPKPINGSGANLEQAIAMQLLLERRIVYYSLIGEAGSGKTMLALALALELLDRGEIRRLYITRAPVAFGEGMGFLPGDANEKMLPWVSGMLGNIDKIAELNPAKAKKIKFWLEGESNDAEAGNSKAKPKKKAAKRAKPAESPASEDRKDRRKRIHILPYSYIRGNTYDNALILVDEVQNMRLPEIKTFATRLGEGSKMIFTGDPSQIDTPYLSETNNGLAWFTNLMRGDPLFASVYFSNSVRSPGVRAVLRHLQEQNH